MKRTRAGCGGAHRRPDGGDIWTGKGGGGEDEEGGERIERGREVEQGCLIFSLCLIAVHNIANVRQGGNLKTNHSAQWMHATPLTDLWSAAACPHACGCRRQQCVTCRLEVSEQVIGGRPVFINHQVGTQRTEITGRSSHGLLTTDGLTARCDRLILV